MERESPHRKREREGVRWKKKGEKRKEIYKATGMINVKLTISHRKLVILRIIGYKL